MDYLTLLQKSIDHMELYIKADISVEDLSQLSGFSLFHYYRLFQQATGKSVKEYMIRRKLIHAIYDISLGRKMLDVALDYGFETYSGFYKAFLKEFHTSPRVYMNTHNICKPIKLDLFDKETIMLSHKKIKEVLQHWDMDVCDIKDIYYDKNGIIKENSWVINQNYILKVGTNIKHLEQHIQLAKVLNSYKLDSSLPILTKTKDEFYVENDLYYYLYHILEGNPIESGACYQNDYLGNAVTMGTMIGTLHKSLSTFNEDLIIKNENIYETIVQWAIPHAKDELSLPEEFYSDLTNNLQSLYDALEKQLIHRNPNPSTIITQNGKLTGFIDLELSERSIRIFDPCYLSTAILSESFTEDDSDKLLKWTHIFHNIIKGYHSIIKLNKEEIKAIPYVIFSIQLIFIAYLKGKNEHQIMLSTNIKMLQWLYEHKELLSVDNILN